MLFVDLRFFLFFAVVLGVYWSLHSNESRKWFLLASSYFFYGSWDWRFAVMLAALSYADYRVALKIADSKNLTVRRRFVTASLAMNLGVLGYFKYCNFFVASGVQLARSAGIELDEPTLHIILPVGVSFFTFQSLSYTIDVYRREIVPVRSARDYMLFAAFFPQLVAGPIVRPKIFVPQLACARTLDIAFMKSALLLFAIGFLKKAAIADNISPYVDAVFQSPSQYTNLATITAVWLYTVQIYCDFSGYSDMAIAVARLMGYELTLNFDAPYLATSLQAFWRKWHISLSTWIRDYIYLSLGGRNSRRIVTYRNLVVTMLAGGLWHGAAWTFVAWGGLHGVGQVVQQEFQRSALSRHLPNGWIRSLLAWFLTIQFVCLCWILFRASSFSSAIELLRGYLFLKRDGPMSLARELTILPILLLTLQFFLARTLVARKIECLPASSLSFGMGVIAAFMLALLPLGNRPFIYFQF
jgi:alginate O-acetyltransferase complex protein AlgI